MRPKSLALLLLALGCGLAASIGISQVMDANSRAGSADLQTTPIYVALHNINLGDPIDASMIALEEWPTSKAPAGAITKIEDLEGRRARTTIIAGTPILEPQLLAFGELADPVANIPDGYRLTTISVDAEKSAAGLLSPGDRVDVQLYVEANARRGISQSKTRLILENVRVFAVESVVQRTAEGDQSRSIPKTVSLLVTPEEASKVALAQNLGELSLIPRSPSDEGSSGHNETTVADLLGEGVQINLRSDERPPAPPQPKNPTLIGGLLQYMQKQPESNDVFKMEVIEAGGVRDVQFDAKTGELLSDVARGGETKPKTEPTQALPASGPTQPPAPTNFPEEGVPEGFPIDFGDPDS